MTSALKRRLTKMCLSLRFLSNFSLCQFSFTSSRIDNYEGLSQIYRDYLIRCVLGTFFASKSYAMIAQPSSILGLDKEILPGPIGEGTQGAETDKKDLPIINPIPSELNQGIDRANLKPSILDKIDSPIHIFSVSAAALLLILFMWFLLKSL